MKQVKIDLKRFNEAIRDMDSRQWEALESALEEAVYAINRSLYNTVATDGTAAYFAGGTYYLQSLLDTLRDARES